MTNTSQDAASQSAYVSPLNLADNPVEIKPFTGKDGEEIIDWLSEFESSAEALGWDEQTRYLTLPAYLRESARDWYTYLVSYKGKPKDYKSLKTELIKDLCSADYRAYLTDKLMNKKQRPDQPASFFIYEVLALAKKVDEKLSKNVIMSVIRKGLLPELQYGVQLRDPKTIEEYIEYARSAERAANDAKRSNSNTSSNPSDSGIFHSIERSLRQLNDNFNRMRLENNQRTRDFCNFCQRVGHIESECRRKARSIPFRPRPNETESRAITQPKNQPQPSQTRKPEREVSPENWRSKRETQQDKPFEPRRSARKPVPRKIFDPSEPSTSKGKGKGKNFSVQAIARSESSSEDSSIEDRDVCSVVSNTNSEQTVNCAAVLFAMDKIKVNDVKTLAIIDTGAEISLIKDSFARQLGLKIRKWGNQTVKSATKHSLPIVGETTVSLKFKDKKHCLLVQTDVAVSSLIPRKQNILIGRDILKPCGINFDNRTDKIVINNPQAISNNSSASETPEVSEESEVSALSEVSSDSQLSTDEEEVEDLETDLVMANSHAKLELNIDESATAETKEKLMQLANEFRKVFAVTAEEIGRTNKFVHKIVTGDHPPIAQQPYRQSAQKREITYQLVQELLRDGIITESFSPWSSPVVLVNKKTGNMCYVL
uniref:Peptidase A2 domain-containing protein n=1 Tax=Tetranychus urticae TaxID=32264 RepID=A0A158P5K5_TETUR